MALCIFCISLHPCKSAVAEEQISVPGDVCVVCGFMGYPD
jgi:hypothetical protein